MECLFSVVSKTVRVRERVSEFIQGVSTMLLGNFRREFPRPKQGKKFAWVYVCKHFSRCSPATCWPIQFMLSTSILRIFICGDTQKLLCIQVQLLMKRHLTSAYSIPVRSFATILGCLKECNSPWSDVSMRVLIRWKTFWALVVNCDLLNNTNFLFFFLSFFNLNFKKWIWNCPP